MRMGFLRRWCPSVGRFVPMHVLPLVLLAAGSPAAAQEVTSTVVVPPQAVSAGSTINVWLVFLEEVADLVHVVDEDKAARLGYLILQFVQ